MKQELWYSVVVRDRYGKVVARERRKSHSFLKAWNQLVYCQMSFLSQSVKDTGGILRATVRYNAGNFTMAAAAGDTVQGIRVGTGNTPVDISDFQLETPIAEGIGGGQMEHLICTVDTSVVAAPSCSFEVHRTIANNSGGVITVLEAGIYMYMYDAGNYYCCGVRDVLTVPQAVPNGGAITIDWTIGMTI